MATLPKVPVNPAPIPLPASLKNSSPSSRPGKKKSPCSAGGAVSLKSMVLLYAASMALTGSPVLLATSSIDTKPVSRKAVAASISSWLAPSVKSMVPKEANMSSLVRVGVPEPASSSKMFARYSLAIASE